MFMTQVGPGGPPQGQQQTAPQTQQQGPNQVPSAGANTAVVPAGQVQDQNQPGAPVPAQPPKQEINTAALCRYGLEVVQEIVSRMTEVFTLLKSLQV